MKAVDAALLAIVGVLAVIAFLNHGQLGISGTPQGTSLGASFGVR